jgi:hypothetical protein
MTADNTIFVDIMADDSSFIGTHKLTAASRYVQKAAATALLGLGLPLTSSIAFRRQGRVVRTVSLEYAARGKAA